MHYLYTDTIFDKPTEDDIRSEKADAAIMADAGYDPETTIKLPMTADLRNHLDIYRLKFAMSEIEAGNQQRLKFLEDEKEVKAERQREALNNASEAIAQQDREAWLREDHDFGGIRMSGKEWEHLGKYAREHREQVKELWAEDGIVGSRADKWLDAIEIQSKGGPKNEAEEKLLNEVQADEKFSNGLEKAAELSGLSPEHASPSQKTSVSNDPVPVAAMDMTF